MMRDHVTNGRKWLLILLICLGLVRLGALGLSPLSDTTEARYGNIARLMVETNDWITPQYSTGVPFWGKPPLATWLSAASMKLFGINEFAARLPSFLLGLAVVLLVWRLAARQRGRDVALAAAVVLASSSLFFIGSGAVMTDNALLLATTLCMVSFWQAMDDSGRSTRWWGYAFFVGLAIGLLAKGPIAIVLTGLPISVWVFWQWKWSDCWQRLPWVSGLVLTALLSVPWYWLAELKTPGFLEYFLVGEHWKRFVEPGWQGDLYGAAHLRQKGTIWFYLLAGTLPWSLILPARMLQKKYRSGQIKRLSEEEGWCLYLVLWTLAPVVFFTLASNILWTYVLPGLPAFAILAADKLFCASSPASEEKVSSLTVLRGGASCMLLLYVLAVSSMNLGYGPAEKSQRKLIASFDVMQSRDKSLTYLYQRPYSAEFYSRGSARVAQNLNDIEGLFRDDTVDFFSVAKGDYEQLPLAFRMKVKNLGLINRHYLLVEYPASSSTAAVL